MEARLCSLWAKVAVVVLLLSAVPCKSLRPIRTVPLHLRHGSTRALTQNDGDSGYRAYTNARVITPPAVKTPAFKTAFTDQDAEAVSASQFTGIHRLTAPADRRTYATVQGVDTTNPDNRDGTIKPRARSVIDKPSGPKLGSGNDIEPILVMGGMAYSQTYQGAKAVASTDSIAMSKGNPGNRKGPDATAISYSLFTNWIPGLRSANPARGSVGVSTAQRVGSLAMSGASNGKIALAQADTAVAMAQSEKKAWYETKWGDP